MNGAVASRFKTDGIIFSVAQYTSGITQYVTLRPGYVIWMGAESPTLDLSPGDVVSVEISGIGLLTNRVVPWRS